MASVKAASEGLHHEWRTLQQQWRATCDLWNDPVRHRFEREFWQEWEQVVPAAIGEMQKMADVLSAARNHVR